MAGSGDAELQGQRRRIAWLATLFAMVGLVISVRLVQWMVLPQPLLDEAQSAVRSLTNRIVATRGNVLDASGQYLAVSTVAYRVSVSPRLLTQSERDALAPVLAGLLELPEEQVATSLAREDTEYEVLADGVPFWTAMEIQDLRKSALRLEVAFGREYPDGDLASAVLGFRMTRDKGQAQYGLEQYWDAELSGRDGMWRGISDLWGQQILVNESGYVPAEDGVDLLLTLDRNIQRRAEEILRETIEEYEAVDGSIVVLDPRTGGILAMAEFPGYSPAAYWYVSSSDVYVNGAVSTAYEPGSVFKPLTIAAALEARVILPTDTYDDRGEIIVGGHRIFNSDLRPHGTTTMTELLAYSRNVGAAHVASLLGPTRFYETVRKFGFSEITGVDLWGEAAGVMRVPGNQYWHMSDLGANSYGQGLSATPLQVAAAFGALANRGVLMRPYIVAEERYPDRTEVRRPFPVRQVVSPAVAEQVSTMLADAVEMGMQKAAVPGYRLAGKSGTAGIGEEGYVSGDAIVSFVGYGPLPDPRFVILAKFDKPEQGRWGVEVAAPAFQQMAKYLIDYYGIPPASNGTLASAGEAPSRN